MQKQFHRFTFRATCSIAALALYSAVSTPAIAQETPPDIQLGAESARQMIRIATFINTLFTEAETARQTGDCKLHKSKIELLEANLNIWARPDSEAFPPEARERWRERLAEAEALPCPPRSDAPKPAPAVAVAPTTTPPPAPPAPVEGLSILDEINEMENLPDRQSTQTVTLDDLIREYRTQCGANGTRERLLIGLDRAIREEKDANRRIIRQGQRERVAAGAEACPPEAPAPKTNVQISPNNSARMDARADNDLLLDQIDRYLKIGDRLEARNLIGGFKLKQMRELTNLDPEQKARLESAELDAFSGDFADAVFRKAVLDSADADRDAKLKAFIGLYYGALFLPQVGIGVRRDGAPGVAPEVDAERTSRRVNSFGISAGFQTKMSDTLDLRATVNYAKGDSASDYSIPASNATQRVDTGIVYGRLSNGSSGVIAGFGGSGSTKTEATNYGASAAVSLSAAQIYAEASGFRVELGVDYERVESDHDLSFGSSGTSGSSTFSFSQTRSQDIDDEYIGVFGGLEFDVPFSGTTDGGLTFSGRIRLGPYHRESDFEGTEHDTANFGPLGNRNLRLDFAEDDSGWGGMIKADAEFEYRLDSGLSFFVGGGIDYRSEVGAVVNPNSGDQVFFEGQTTRLEQDDATRWNLIFGTRLRF